MSAPKDSNPKDVAGSARIDMTLISAVACAEEALAMEEGGTKYGYYNYTAVGVKTRVYIAAALRHLWKYLMGEDRDPKTGVHHLGSVRACAGIILEAESRKKLTDDRPPANPAASSWLDNMEARVKHVRDTFKGFRPQHFTRDQLDGTGKQIHSAYREKMHNAYRGGTPDVWYSGPGGDLWVEYKWSTSKKGVLVPALSSLQRDWLTKRKLEGRNVAVVVGSPTGATILEEPDHWTSGSRARWGDTEVVDYIEVTCLIRVGPK
jgi:hypothetical protein